MSDDYIKQVIIIRRDLGMRRGKEIAQGSHASMAFLSNAVRKSLVEYAPVKITDEQARWLNEKFTKVVLQARDEVELLEYHHGALEKGLESHLITDSGKTEFDGKPTNTAVAIGPDYASKIDEVTGDAKLY